MGLSLRPKPAPLPDPAHPRPVPDVRASVLSKTFFCWVSPLLRVGFSRPLMLEDLWEIDEGRRSAVLGDRLEAAFYARRRPELRPRHLRPKLAVIEEAAGVSTQVSKAGSEETLPTHGEPAEFKSQAGEKGAQGGAATGAVAKQAKAEAQRKNKDSKKGKEPEYDEMLFKAVLGVWGRTFVFALFLLLISSLLTALTPLVSKRLLSFLTNSYDYAKASDAERATMTNPSWGIGFGLAIGLVAMQEVSSILQTNYNQQTLQTGMQIRTALTAAISRKALRLSGKARTAHPNGTLVQHLAGDCTFIERATQQAPNVLIQPITIVVAVVILLVYLGYSALVGLFVLLASSPLQSFLFRRMIDSRHGQMRIGDHRMRILQEVINGIRVVKLYGYEKFFQTKIQGFRDEEMYMQRKIALVRATMTSSMSFLPVLAAVLTFVTYAGSGHTLDTATIFASLQLFNVLKNPLSQLPMSIAMGTDAMVAMARIEKCLRAEEIQDELVVDSSAKDAVRAKASFAWETNKPELLFGKGAGRPDKKQEHAEIKAVQDMILGRKRKVVDPEPEQLLDEKDRPFELRDVDLTIPRGSFTCIVGRVGSGKSSLLQGLVGEMKRIEGEVVFGGSTSYFSQQPWIVNASVKENILFGRPYDEHRLQAVIDACALAPDLEILADGLETEIGEKGINLSGGQKARVSLARAAYYDADVVLLDDPLSAVDAHVAHHLTDKCFVEGPMAGKTRLLVTHHLDVLPHADHIVVMDAGRIVEQGAYADLVAKAYSLFAKLFNDFGTATKDKDPTDVADAAAPTDDLVAHPLAAASSPPEQPPVAGPPGFGPPTGGPPPFGPPGGGLAAKGRAPGQLMQEEERRTGAVAGYVWFSYFRSMGHPLMGPLMILLYACTQAATISNTIILSFWSADSIKGWSRSDYMGAYAGLGVATCIFTFVSSFLLYWLATEASYHLFNNAIVGLMRSKVAWFDTTPVGRIMSRMSKDIMVLDGMLPMELNMLLSQVFSVFGTVALVFYVYPLLGVIFVPLLVLYGWFATYYRASSREVKRLDSNLRSFIYSSFSEQVSGMASVRAYRQQKRFTDKTEAAVDQENRAFLLTLTLQCWLGVRLEALGNTLLLGIALVAVGLRDTINPSKIGVVLTYALSVTSVFAQLVTVFAEVEQDMNTAERVAFYGQLEPEAAPVTDKDPGPEWPEAGHIQFDEIKMAYRPGLPDVLKGVTFEVRPGEKVGIVGRTGAGKSSLLQALFRIVEVREGRISIDGRDIGEMGLDVLRKRLSVIPQDALLYAGTVRQNLDPEGTKSDAELHSALARAGLIPKPDAPQSVVDRFAKFKLDASVADDGSNFSAGERQLVALCRALVKNSKVIVLDEATSSVDVETDSSVQKAIQDEFRDQTLLCVAHRLQTVAFYDRILVMEQGRVAEFDTVLALFDRAGSIFRGMCDKAGLSREDIVRIRVGAGKDV